MNIKSIYQALPTRQDCITHLESVRWGTIPTCPYCSSRKSSSIGSEMRYHCNTCHTTYSVTVGTIFHNTRCDIQKWIVAIHLFLHNRHVLSLRALAQEIGVTKDTASYMMARIKRTATEHRSFLINVINLNTYE